LGSTRANLTGLWRYWRSYYQTKRAPCDAACPVGNQVVDYIQTALQGHWRQAANTLRAENPLPAVTGRRCHRPCEVACNRRQVDERIAIHDVESVLAEIEFEWPCFPAGERSYPVAVLGSGPAELAFAHFMALLHHRVTLFEPAAALGGPLRGGAHARHLPEAILDTEIMRVVAGRMQVEHGPVSFDDLKAGHDVVFGLQAPDRPALYVSGPAGQLPGPGRPGEAPMAGGAHEDTTLQTPLRVSEAIGYAKWAALLLDAEWRGLHPGDTMSRILVGGSSRIVSALKYHALLTGGDVRRTEEVVTFDKLNIEMLDSGATPKRLPEPYAAPLAAGSHAATADVERVAIEAARCLSCGRCNECDNCWIYCPDAVISRDEGVYRIDYDYCKGCSLCASVCPRAVISIIEEEKWSG
jgi:2-oxoacid:acceptor oxidoreductase delta subunit (pyruvate/2-ketoisovalerate family)